MFWGMLEVTLSVKKFPVRGCSDKSLARPGMKKATATKLGIYYYYYYYYYTPHEAQYTA